MLDLLVGAGSDDATASDIVKAVEDDFITWFPAEYKTPIELFFACQTQWRTTMSGVIGFDYVAVDVVRRALKIKLSPKQFRLLQVMENEAVKWMASS